MMNKIKETIKEPKGMISLLIVVLVFILALCTTAFSDIVSKTWIINEVQSSMDVAGINALNKSIDNTLLREEILGIDKGNNADTSTGKISLSDYESKIIAQYKREINTFIKTNDRITSINVEQASVDFGYDKWGLGSATKERPQIILDTVTKLKLKGSSTFDLTGGINKQVYSSRNNSNFTVSYQGKAEDGTHEIVVRSVTRLVYR